MQRRTFIALLAAAPAALAACGSDGTTLPPANTAGEPEVPATVAPTAPMSSPATDPDLPSAEETVIVSLTDEGGFTTREYAFQNPPALVVTDQGRVITAGITTLEFPGPLLPQHMVQSITPAGIDQLIDALLDAGLLEELDLELSDDIAIADASTTVLTISTDGTSIRHEAYALGIGGGPGEPIESAPDRQTLLDGVSLLRGDLSLVIDEGLGAPMPWTPDALQVMVLSTSGLDLSADVTIVDWPESAETPLASLGVDSPDCTEVDDPAVVAELLDADQLTFFRDPAGSAPDDVVQIIARPAYPGRSCDT